MTQPYADSDLARAEIDAIMEPILLEFGSNYCGICSAASPHVEAALSAHTGIRHLKVEDGRGKKLGRSFGIKLWPTLVFMSSGKEVARLVRPRGAAAISDALAELDRA